MPNVIMPPPPPTPNLAGVSDLNTLVQAIIERPKDVGGFMKEYREVIAKYDEMTKKYGSLKKIEALQKTLQEEQDKAAEDRAFAAAQIGSAEGEAKEIVQKAMRRGIEIKAELDEEASKLKAKTAALTRRENTFDAKKKADEEDLARREENWKTRWAAAEAKEELVNARLAELESFTAKLKG